MIFIDYYLLLVVPSFRIAFRLYQDTFSGVAHNTSSSFFSPKDTAQYTTHLVFAGIDRDNKRRALKQYSFATTVFPHNILTMTTTKSTTTNNSPITLRSIFWTKDAYRHVAAEFYPCHSQPLNLVLHVLGAGIQMWGAVQLLLHFQMPFVVYLFGAYVGLSVPLVTALLHTAMLAWMAAAPIPATGILSDVLLQFAPLENKDPYILGCLLAFACGFLKDVGHHVCQEPPFIGNYVKDRPYMFFFHATWHLPFLIDAYSPFSTVPPRSANTKTTKTL